jgi:hypothetical protein
MVIEEGDFAPSRGVKARAEISALSDAPSPPASFCTTARWRAAIQLMFGAFCACPSGWARSRLPVTAPAVQSPFWLHAFQFAIAARAASRRLVSTGVFSDGCSDRASIMAASPDRSWQLPRQAIISSVDIGSNQLRDLKSGTRLSVGRCWAASYVDDAGCRFAFAGQIAAFARHSWARGRATDHAPRVLV